MVSFCRENWLSGCAAAVLPFFMAGLLYLLHFERVDHLGAYRIPFGDRPSHLIYYQQLRGHELRLLVLTVETTLAFLFCASQTIAGYVIEVKRYAAFGWQQVSIFDPILLPMSNRSR